MTRADKSRLLYVLAILLVGCISLAVGWRFNFRPSAMIIISLLLLIPGRLPAMFRKLTRAEARERGAVVRSMANSVK